MEKMKEEEPQRLKELCKKKIIEKFGEELRTIPGLLEALYIESQKFELVAVDIKKEEGVAAFILDEHWRDIKLSSRVGMASIIGIFRDGQIETKIFPYQNQYDLRKDDLSLNFNKVEIIEITPTAVQVKAIPGCEEHSPSEFTFPIPQRSK